ncbi:MAG: calcium:proton antiporter, partial [Miltoncostaeaceae bacterium]
RDTMFAVAMLVMNGMVGFSLIYGGIRHHEQSFNLQGANAYLAIIVPVALLGMVLPNYTRSTADASLTTYQAVGAAILFLALVFSLRAVSRRRRRRGAPDAENG